MLAKPLLKEAAIGSIILENPFYGKRKPNNQVLVYFLQMNVYIMLFTTGSFNDSVPIIHNTEKYYKIVLGIILINNNIN